MLKVVLIGPESTAKTTLAQALAKEFKGAFVEEYSRSYAIAHERELGYDDVMPIVYGQMFLEDQAEKQNKEIVFLDSNILASKVYSLWYYGKAPEELLLLLKDKKYDFYLLCRPDIPWEEDPARSMSDQADRESIFEVFENQLIATNARYQIIKGNGQDRYLLAGETIKNLCAATKDVNL